tara:strand:+ start:2448 stop:2585 length:138 start_codon:yes stop_codon:yes gene_type:complete
MKMRIKKPLHNKSKERWTGFVVASRNGGLSRETGLLYGSRTEFRT